MEVEELEKEKDAESLEKVIQTDKTIKLIDLTSDEVQNSSQTNSQKLSICQTQSHHKKSKFISKPIHIQLLPQYNEVHNVEYQFLVGELYLSFDFDNSKGFNNRISVINNIKRIENTVVHKKSRFLEIKLEQKVSSIKYFQNIANKLSLYPNKNIHLLGLLLNKYQEVIFKIFEILKFYNEFNPKPPQYIEQFITLKRQFEQKKLEYLNNFQQDEFIYLTDQSVNFTTKELEINSIFLSEPFLILLGTSVEQYERYVHRYGLSEFMDQSSQLKLNILLLRIIMQQYGIQMNDLDINDITTNNSIQITLHSLDHIQIPAKMVYYPIIPNSFDQHDVQNLQQSQALMLSEFRFEIEPIILQQVIQLRLNQQSQQQGVYDQGYMNDIDYSLDYSLQSELFLQTNQLQNIQSIYTQRASYRIITSNERKKEKNQNTVEIICD